MNDATETTDPDTLVLIHDGACPMCSRYARMTRLKATVEHVELVDARGSEWGRLQARERGLSLDDGMLALYGGEVWHGADALHLIALLTTTGRRPRRMAGALLRHRRLARAIYPVLRAGRNLLLRLRGQPLLSE